MVSRVLTECFVQLEPINQDHPGRLYNWGARARFIAKPLRPALWGEPIGFGTGLVIGAETTF